MFRINLYRSPVLETPDDHNKTSEKHQRNIGEASEKHRRNIGEKSSKHRRQSGADLNDTQRRILELLSVDARLSAVKLAEQTGVASRNVETNIKKLKERGILIRHGSPKGGYWEIIDNKN